MSDDMIKEKIIFYTSAKIFNDGVNFTMESIAKDLGISKKTLYKHFNNRSEILNAVIDRLLSSISDNFSRSFKNHKDGLAAICEAFSVFANTYAPKLSRKLFDDLRKYEPEIWKKVDDFRITKFKNYFPLIIKDGIEKKYFREDINPDVFLLMYITSVQGIMNPEVLSKASFSTKEAALHIIKTLFYGVTTPKGKKIFDKHFTKIAENLNEN